MIPLFAVSVRYSHFNYYTEKYSSRLTASLLWISRCSIRLLEQLRRTSCSSYSLKSLWTHISVSDQNHAQRLCLWLALHSIVSAMTTYLIILIQFQLFL